MLFSIVCIIAYNSYCDWFPSFSYINSVWVSVVRCPNSVIITPSQFFLTSSLIKVLFPETGFLFFLGGYIPYTSKAGSQVILSQPASWAMWLISYFSVKAVFFPTGLWSREVVKSLPRIIFWTHILLQH